MSRSLPARGCSTLYSPRRALPRRPAARAAALPLRTTDAEAKTALSSLAEVPVEPFAAAASFGGLLARLSRDANPVRTVAVMRPGRGPSLFLPVLASMGSHVGALGVTDRNYAVLMRALRGKLRDDRQSMSLSVRWSPDLGIVSYRECDQWIDQTVCG